jgi:hypothetical protein
MFSSASGLHCYVIVEFRKEKYGNTARRKDRYCVSLRKWTSILRLISDVHTKWWLCPSICLSVYHNTCWSRDSSVSIVTRLQDGRLENRGLIPGRGKRFLPSPQHPERLWSPPSLLANAYRRLFPQEQDGQSTELTTHLRLESKLRILGAVPPFLAYFPYFEKKK